MSRCDERTRPQPPPCFWLFHTGVSRGQQEGRISSTMHVRRRHDGCAGHQGWPGHSHGAADGLHGHPCRSRRRGRRRRSGSAPGTIETDLLDPVNLVQQVHAVFLSGGSAFGLDVATGVRKYLYERKIGFETRVCQSADRARRDLVRSRRRQPARHLADGRLRLSRGAPTRRTGSCRRQRRRRRRRDDRQNGRRRSHERRTGNGVDCGAARAPTRSIVGAIVAVNAVGDVIDPAQRQRSSPASARRMGKGLADARRLLRAGGRAADSRPDRTRPSASSRRTRG